LEDALRALGVTVWAMEKYEADDALASAVRVACEDHTVHKVFVLTPDKDLGQVVQGKRVVQMDRRNNVIIDEGTVKEKFGVGPSSIADYLGLVGDSADGFPGLQGWGAKSASTELAKYGTIDNIPDNHEQWVSDGVTVRGAEKLATTLRANREIAQLFKTLATLVHDVEVGEITDWKWNGPTDRFELVCKQLNCEHLLKKVQQLK
jgi:5'-3' exonuclease